MVWIGCTWEVRVPKFENHQNSNHIKLWEKLDCGIPNSEKENLSCIRTQFLESFLKKTTFTWKPREDFPIRSAVSCNCIQVVERSGNSKSPSAWWFGIFVFKCLMALVFCFLYSRTQLLLSSISLQWEYSMGMKLSFPSSGAEFTSY